MKSVNQIIKNELNRQGQQIREQKEVVKEASRKLNLATQKVRSFKHYKEDGYYAAGQHESECKSQLNNAVYQLSVLKTKFQWTMIAGAELRGRDIEKTVPYLVNVRDHKHFPVAILNLQKVIVQEQYPTVYEVLVKDVTAEVTSKAKKEVEKKYQETVELFRTMEKEQMKQISQIANNLQKSSL